MILVNYSFFRSYLAIFLLSDVISCHIAHCPSYSLYGNCFLNVHRNVKQENSLNAVDLLRNCVLLIVQLTYDKG
jgi:hypothetical protein